MHQNSFKTSHWVPILCMILIMTNGKAAANGAAEGITLCIKVVIPSLFPFFIFSVWLNPFLAQLRLPIPRYLRKILRISYGCDGILLLGLLGGYPVGAQSVAVQHKKYGMDKRTANILLAFCSNAGPAFIFGVTRILFTQPYIPWLLWSVQISSALITGMLLPAPEIEQSCYRTDAAFSANEIMAKSIHIMASVCGWVVICKAIVAIIPPIPNTTISLILNGFIELSGGCISLTDLPSQSARFLLCAVFLSFGGLCVMMQTASVTGNLGLGLYPMGKIMQTFVTILITIPLSFCIFGELPTSYPVSLCIWLVSAMLLLFIRKTAEKKLWKLCSY